MWKTIRSNVTAISAQPVVCFYADFLRSLSNNDDVNVARCFSQWSSDLVLTLTSSLSDGKLLFQTGFIMFFLNCASYFSVFFLAVHC